MSLQVGSDVDARKFYTVASICFLDYAYTNLGDHTGDAISKVGGTQFLAYIKTNHGLPLFFFHGCASMHVRYVFPIYVQDLRSSPRLPLPMCCLFSHTSV